MNSFRDFHPLSACHIIVAVVPTPCCISSSEITLSLSSSDSTATTTSNPSVIKDAP